jgi:hypothetical protein
VALIRFGRLRLQLTPQQIREGARPACVRGVTDVCRKVHNRASILCPVDTGNLRAHHGMRVNSARCTGEVFNDAKYVEAVHDGTSAHLIVAGRKKALAFNVGGKAVYVKSVWHPGTRPRRWLMAAGGEVAAASGYRWSPER